MRWQYLESLLMVHEDHVCCEHSYMDSFVFYYLVSCIANSANFVCCEHSFMDSCILLSSVW